MTQPRDNAGICEEMGQGKKPSVPHLDSRVAPLHEITFYSVAKRPHVTCILQHQRRVSHPVSKREVRKYASAHVFMQPWVDIRLSTEVRQAVDSAHEFELQLGILKMKHKTVYGKKRLVLEQHDLGTIWSAENIVSGLMGEWVATPPPQDISVSLLDSEFPEFFHTKSTAAGGRLF